jgi:hypothetical protein
MLHLLDRWELGGVDLMETAAEAGEGPDVGVDRGAAQVFEQVIVQVDAVETRPAGKHLVQVREVIVDEMRKRLRWVHARSYVALSACLRGARILPMVQ